MIEYPTGRSESNMSGSISSNGRKPGRTSRTSKTPKTSRISSVGTKVGIWTPAGSVKSKKIEWLWYPYIPLGYITNLVGMGSAGKSTFTAFLAAQVTTGRPFLKGMKAREPGNVLIIESEQGLAEGVTPKLEANGADSNAVMYLDMVLESGMHKYFDISTDCSVVEQVIELSKQTEQQVKMIVIDPITAYMGKANCNDNAQVRQALLPLQDLALKHGVAVIAINHFSKREEAGVEFRSLGSVAFYNVARSEMLIHRERDADTGDVTGRRFMGLNKYNSVKEDNPDTLVFRIVDGMVCFEGKPDGRSIGAVMSGKKGRPETVAAKQYKGWLKECVENGQNVVADEAMMMAKKFGVKQAAIYRLTREMGFSTNGRANGGVWKYTGVKMGKAK